MFFFLLPKKMDTYFSKVVNDFFFPLLHYYDHSCKLHYKSFLNFYNIDFFHLRLSKEYKVLKITTYLNDTHDLNLSSQSQFHAEWKWMAKKGTLIFVIELVHKLKIAFTSSGTEHSYSVKRFFSEFPSQCITVGTEVSLSFSSRRNGLLLFFQL
jgi:hypothetical protein